MLDVKMEGELAIIDVRKQALKKEHPGDKVLEFIDQAHVGIVFEIHVPHKAQPLVEKIEEMGLKVSTNKLEEDHYYLTATK
ncbi:amino acid decarboxylase [Virgibacillus kimchii]